MWRTEKRRNQGQQMYKILGYKKTLLFSIKWTNKFCESTNCFHYFRYATAIAIATIAVATYLFYTFVRSLGRFDCRPRFNIYSHFFDLSLLYDPIYRLEGWNMIIGFYFDIWMPEPPRKYSVYCVVDATPFSIQLSCLKLCLLNRI